VSHRALLVPPDSNLRATLLEDVVTVELSRPQSKAIVFTNTKRDADELATGAAFKSLSTGVLHGDLSQVKLGATFIDVILVEVVHLMRDDHAILVAFSSVRMPGW